MAEGLFIQQATQAGLADRYFADSAGTADYHVGEPPDARMRRVAARRGLIYDHRARQFQRYDLDRYDLILAMDRENRDDLFVLAQRPEQRVKIHLLREYDPEGGLGTSVPDPYYGGLDGFEDVYNIIERSVRGLLRTLEDESQNPNING